MDITDRVIPQEVRNLAAERGIDISKLIVPTGKPEDSRRIYDEIARDYCGAVLVRNYIAPTRLVNLFEEVVIDKDASILDMGAGTGLVGQKLYEKGYKNLYAADVSPLMLREARSEGVYKALVSADLTAATPFRERSFDHAICVGVLNPKIAPPSILDTSVRMVKPGGYFIFDLEQELYNDHNSSYRQKIEQLLDDGQVEEIQKLDFGLPYLHAEPHYGLVYKVLK